MKHISSGNIGSTLFITRKKLFDLFEYQYVQTIHNYTTVIFIDIRICLFNRSSFNYKSLTDN